jgi:PEP-CTERM motif
MKKQTLVLTLVSLSLTTPALAQTVLYSATGGQRVSQFGGWTVFPTTFESFSSGSTLYDTSAINSLQGGFTRQDHVLNRAAGLSLGFTMQVTSETHDGTNGPNRAGVSVIAVTSDLMGIELGFWADRVWAQSGPSFTKAEEGLFNTTAALASYSLNIVGNNYQLLANGNPVVSGLLRDYSSFGTPYNIPNFLFFGDNTTSARGSFRTSQITLGSVAPEPTTLGLLALGGVLLARRRRG